MLTAADRLMQEGLQQGLQRGLHSKALGIAKKMLAKGDKISDIQELTELSYETLEQLSADGSEAGSPSRVLKSVSNTALLAQGVSSSTFEQIGGEVMDNASSSVERNQAGAILKNPCSRRG